MLLGDGAGNYATTTAPSVVGSWFAVGDLNGDGHADALGSGNGFASAVLGDGSGSFEPEHLYSCPGGRPLLGDVYGDGNLDAVVASGVGAFFVFRGGDSPVDVGPFTLDAQPRIFPNPARGPVTIELRMVHAGEISGRILDVAGRVVAILPGGPAAAGTRRWLWDGRRETGDGVAAGVYWVELRMPDRTVTGRMVRAR